MTLPLGQAHVAPWSPGVGVLNKKYGFIWYYTPMPANGDRSPGFGREDAAKVLSNQFAFSLIDYRSLLLAQGKLSNAGEQLGVIPSDLILDNSANRCCSNREYAQQVR
jgi:hypothetical protein